jgi:hypothetical protein
MCPELSEPKFQQPSALVMIFDTNATALNYLISALTEFYIGMGNVMIK